MPSDQVQRIPWLPKLGTCPTVSKNFHCNHPVSKFPATLNGETCVLAGRRISMNFPCQALKNLDVATETPCGAAPDTQTLLF